MSETDTTVIKKAKIVNRKGLHARASAKLAHLAMTLPTTVFIIRNGETANSQSIMDLLMLAAHQGSDIEIKATGPNAESSVDAVASLIADGFGERDDDD